MNTTKSTSGLKIGYWTSAINTQYSKNKRPYYED